ncbi:MAG TPA: efflux RND transporter periplasmic adaptor subunit [Geminicoccaceae bacterium]|nr:efflux RND transporter periplasmic adaptor subunit [Geminicoccaceae bacterium]
MKTLLLASALAAAFPALAQERFDCVLDPSAIVKVGTPVPGQLSEVMVQRGSKVELGQPIARMESSVEAATVALGALQAESLAAITAQEARVDLATRKLQRASKLATNQIVAQQEIDTLQAELAINEQELARVTEQRDLARLELARSKAILELRTIKSPLRGVVTEHNLTGGEYVSQDNHILTIAALDPLYVETFLPVRLYAQVKVGQTATVGTEAPISGRYEARVSVVDQVFDAASGTFGVRLELPNPDEALPAGLRCQVSFEPTSASAGGSPKGE